MKKDNIEDILKKLQEMLHHIVINEDADIEDSDISGLLWEHFYELSCRMKSIEIILTKINTEISKAELVRISTTEFVPPF